MIPDLSTTLSWLETNPQSLQGISRGVEREGLRINTYGNLAQTSHPASLGSALTHKYIKTDFAESLLEFITPVNHDIYNMLTLLHDIHRYVARRLNEELIWPMSMPNFIKSTDSIKLAQYGSSNIGKMKTLYRKGLKNRYSAIMEVIAGVHYNFSLPLIFWQTYAGIHDEISGKEIISSSYLRLIRNYYRFGWLIPYLFGASPAICPSLLNGRKTNLPFKQAPSGFIYLPYATSLRLSDLGFTNKFQGQLDITFNQLDEYVRCVKHALKTPLSDYQCIGLQKDGHYLQLNTNILQIENELYAPIRPKRVTLNNESLSDALLRGGIEYVEVRSLDINPFSPYGIEEEQVRFLDLFLIWCTLAEVPEMSAEELRGTRINWNRVILEGRKPGLMLIIDCDNTEQPLTVIGTLLFEDLQRVAKILDSNNQNTCYQKVCDKLLASLDYPELTFSARLLNKLIECGMNKLGLLLANKYFEILCNEPLQILKEPQLDEECLQSWQRQYDLEVSDCLSFDEFLGNYNKYLLNKNHN